MLSLFYLPYLLNRLGCPNLELSTVDKPVLEGKSQQMALTTLGETALAGSGTGNGCVINLYICLG